MVVLWGPCGDPVVGSEATVEGIAMVVCGGA